MTRRISADRIVCDVIDHFVTTGEDSDVASIASRLGCSASTVRRHLVTKSGGVADARLQQRQEHRVTHSRDYSMFEVGSTRVWMYGPTREVLRTMLRAAVACNAAWAAEADDPESGP